MALLVTVAAFTALGVLAFSGISHARHHVTFGQLLEQQRVWPSRARSVVLVGTISLELLLGLGGLFILVNGFGTPRLAQTIFAASTVLFLAYLAFAAYLVRWRPGAPCACGSTHEVVNSWTVARAGILAAAALAATITPAAAYRPPRPGMYGFVTVVGSLSLAVILWALPGALEDPTRRPANQHAGSMEAT
jgi:methylamine utilization protein MauE